MIITSIIRNEKDTSIYDVFIDNTYSFSIPEEDYLRLNLYDKNEISEQELKSIKNALNFSSAKTKAFSFLSYRMRSSKEIENKLLDEGFSKTIVSKVIKDLKADGYINDMLYVRKYIYDRNKLKPKAKRMLAYELKKKGIDDNIVEQGLKELGQDNILVAKELIHKKYGECDLSNTKMKNKVFQFLRYRGFSDSEIKRAINEFYNETDFKKDM